ncbi:MAG: UDP-N-acetylmuramate dehydrogenase [Bacteroidetes bacterium]|nr:UDP-N-acetylmuramate dehydrogenase [Bacteroidota bacterium]
MAFHNAMHLDQKVSLKTLHTFGMEVEARYFVEAKTHSEVLTLLNYRHMIHMPILFLGGGSNVLFTRDFPGIVIRIHSKGITIREQDDHHVVVTAEAGENWDEFVQHCVNNHWIGLENLSLIPGTVGAAPIQNIGAYGVEVKDFIESVQVVEIDSGKQKRYSNIECEFGYRDSIFKRALKGKVIILNVTFKLIKVGEPGGERVAEKSLLNLDYGDIRGELQRLGVTDPDIGDVRTAVCNIRRKKLPDPAEVGNAGSFFKNPVIGKALLDSLQSRFPEIPSYAQLSDDDFKIPAAWLIEQCGWKGYRNGDAGVHPNQPLVLVNYGAATGSQIVELAKKITDSVQQRFGIRLETEVNILGSL